MVSKIDESEAIRFLKLLYRNCEDGMLNIRILPGGKNYFISLNNLDRITKIISHHKHQDIYFGVALRKGEDGTKKGIHLIPALWVDHDNVTTDVEKKIYEFYAPPSIVVQTSSPERRQYYWILKEPVGPEEIERTETDLSGIAHYFGGDKNACDASRILRLPGTHNYKYKPPCICRLVSTDGTREYMLDDFESLPGVDVNRATLTHSEIKILLQGVEEGRRNATAVRLVGHWFGIGYSEERVLHEALAWNQRNKPPLPVCEIARVVNSIHKAEEEKNTRVEEEIKKVSCQIIELQKKQEETYPIEKKVFPKFPEEAWVGIAKEYRDLISPSTEAPDAFHFGVISSILGLCLGRKFYFFNPHPVFQNYYFIVVGTSSIYHKGTAVRFGEEVSEELEENIKTMQVVVSSEGIFKILADEQGTRLLVVNDELRTLFANAHRAGTLNIFSNLCTLYDIKKNLIVGQKNTMEIKDGLLSMISAVTTEWISETSEIEAALGGFINRNIILAGKVKGPIPNPTPPDNYKKKRFIEEVKEWKKELSKKEGEIKKSKEAMDLYEDYYYQWFENIHNSPQINATLKGREPHHVIKLSALFALENTRMEILQGDIERAINVVDHSSICQSIIFKEIDIPKQTRLENKVIELLKDGPKTKRSICTRMSSYSSYGDRVKAIENVYKAGMIDIWLKNNPRGKKTEWYYLPEHASIIEDIIHKSER